MLQVGDALGQVHGGALYSGIITDISGNDVTVRGGPFIHAAITALHPISCAVEFNKLTGGTPADLKMVGQSSFLFRENGVHDTVTTFSSEITTVPEEVIKSATGWGEFPWGNAHYGSPPQQLLRVEPLPEPVAVAAQLSVGFTTCQALATFEFLGIDVVEKDDAKVNYG